MRFDPNKPYGVVVNHPWIRYEQGGHSFGQDGREVGEPEVVPNEPEELDPPPINNEQKPFAVNNAAEFLKTILHDGPLTRSVVFNECNANNQDWDAVKTAFAEMGGEAVKRRNVTYWKLKAE